MNRRDVLRSAPAGLMLASPVLAAPCLPGAGSADATTTVPNDCGPRYPSWFAAAAEKQWIIPRLAAGLPVHTQLREVTSGNVVSVPSGRGSQPYPRDRHLIGTWTGHIAMDDYYAIVAQGGHNGSSDNGVYVFGPFSSETPQWVRVFTSDEDVPRPSTTTGSAWYPTGNPAARHGYSHAAYIPDLGSGVGNEWLSVWCSSPFGRGGGDGEGATQSFQFAANPQDAAGTTPGQGSGFYRPHGYNETWPPHVLSRLEAGATVWDPVAQRLVFAAATRRQPDLWEFNPFTRRWSSTAAAPGGLQIKAGAIDPNRRILVGYQAQSGGNVTVYDLGANKGDAFSIQVGGDNPEGLSGRPGMAFEAVGGKFCAWDGNADIYVLQIPANFRKGTEDPRKRITEKTGWTWERVPGILGAAPETVRSGTFGKFHYIASIGCLAAQSWTEGDLHCFKVPVGGL